MAGVGLTYDLGAIQVLRTRVAKLGRIDRRLLLDTIGDKVASQTKDRIEDVKEAPDGSAWPEWSPKYMATRPAGKSFLEGEGFLLGSMTHAVALAGDTVEVGSNMIYAATHQFGDMDERNIPARPYLGLSGDNEADLEEVIDNFMQRVAP